MVECCLTPKRIDMLVVENKTKCSICKCSVFKVERLTPELVTLTCDSCGESHMIGSDVSRQGTQLCFLASESDEFE